jgi:hypothetical protein
MQPEDLEELAAELRAKGLLGDARGVVIEDESQGVVTIHEVAYHPPADELTETDCGDLAMAAGGDPDKVPTEYRKPVRAHLKGLKAQLKAMRDHPTMDVHYADGRTQRYHLPPLRWNATAQTHEYRHAPRSRQPRPRPTARPCARAPDRLGEPDEPPRRRQLTNEDRRRLKILVEEARNAKIANAQRAANYEEWRECARCGLEWEPEEFGRAGSYCLRCEAARAADGRRRKTVAT